MRTTSRALLAASAVGLMVPAASCGGDHGTAPATGAIRSIAVTMTDNAFRPAEVRASKGETVRFTFTNRGTVDHEAILGDDHVQSEHHEQMTRSTGTTGSADHEDPGTDHHGGDTDGGAVTVAPGAVGELTHTFTESGTLLLGCHEPGHWEAGMKADVIVS